MFFYKMGKKKTFIDKTTARRFVLVHKSFGENREGSENDRIFVEVPVRAMRPLSNKFF